MRGGGPGRVRIKVMTKRLLRRLLLFAALCAASASCAGAPEAELRQTKLRAEAAALVEALSAGDYARAVDRFDAPMRRELPPERMRALWEAIVKAAGPFRRGPPDARPHQPRPPPAHRRHL